MYINVPYSVPFRLQRCRSWV